MHIKEITLNHFRNYEDIMITLDTGINIFQGSNAQGKTNILESIYLCATARSHRTSQEKEVIKWHEDAAHIQLYVQKRNLDDRIDFHITQKGKSVAINKLSINKLGELFGTLTVVMFSPEDLQLIKKSPKERRRFIDIELCQLDKLYYYSLKQYHKVLKQRNTALKQYYLGNKDMSIIDVWDAQLSQYAKQVIERRMKFIEEISNMANKIHADISGGKENLQVIYEPNTKVENFEDRLVRYRQKDLLAQNTSVGPHRDDLSFLINDMDVRTYGSQGQQRTVVLSMKLAELQIMKEKLNETPILLLDDVLSELDHFRQEYLFNYTKGIQTLITCTGIEQSVWNTQKIGKLFNISNGMVV